MADNPICEMMGETTGSTALASAWFERRWFERRREDVGVALLGTVGALLILYYVATFGSKVQRVNDFYREVWPAYRTLASGHLVEFIRIGPAYVGSALLRAPFGLLPMSWGGGAKQVFFAAALPCVVALTAFAAWLGTQRTTADGKPRRLGVMLLCLLSPVTIIALVGGHPEEILGGVLCVVGVVLAANGEVEWASVVIGLAVINKAWALVAVPVALVVTPDRRVRGALIMAATAGAVLIPIWILRSTGGVGDGAALGTGLGKFFNPPQLLWWFGRHSWIALHSRELIVLTAFACALLWWRRSATKRPSADRVADALLLLAMVLLLRAALDPWNNFYYHVPFVLALLAYEVRRDRPPVLALVFSLVILPIIPIDGPTHVSDAFQAVLYAALVLPLLCWMALRLFLPEHSANRDAAREPVAILRRSPSPGR
jgi:hypothetical protein